LKVHHRPTVDQRPVLDGFATQGLSSCSRCPTGAAARTGFPSQSPSRVAELSGGNAVTDPTAPSALGLLGPLEYGAMQVLWEIAPADVASVRAQLNDRPSGRPLAYTTVMTVLSRLHDKGLVERSRHGRAYVYRARFDEAELVAHLGRRELEDLLDRYGTAVVAAQFATAVGDADPDLVARLRQLAGDRDDA
jgi:predicted transcriptional regulator